MVSLEALESLGLQLSAEKQEVSAQLKQAFDTAEETATELVDPILAGVVTPSGRLRVEVLQQAIQSVQTVSSEALGPMLGVSAGFNSLDGD
mgnify:CR=1 FL=1